MGFPPEPPSALVGAAPPPVLPDGGGSLQPPQPRGREFPFPLLRLVLPDLGGAGGGRGGQKAESTALGVGMGIQLGVKGGAPHPLHPSPRGCCRCRAGCCGRAAAFPSLSGHSLHFPPPPPGSICSEAPLCSAPSRGTALPGQPPTPAVTAGAAHRAWQGAGRACTARGPCAAAPAPDAALSAPSHAGRSPRRAEPPWPSGSSRRWVRARGERPRAWGGVQAMGKGGGGGCTRMHGGVCACACVHTCERGWEIAHAWV